MPTKPMEFTRYSLTQRIPKLIGNLIRHPQVKQYLANLVLFAGPVNIWNDRKAQK